MDQAGHGRKASAGVDRGAGGRPSRLGRGLAGLIGAPVPVEAGAARGAAPAEGGVAPSPNDNITLPGIAAGPGRVPRTDELSDFVMVEAAIIVPSRYQARRRFNEDSLRELADSIARSGMLQPVLVRPRENGYELVAGERRWRAAVMAGVQRIPALVRPLTEEEAAEWGLVENLQREDLNPVERAIGLRRLCERFGWSQEEVGRRVGLERSSVANMIRLAELEPEIAELLEAGRLSPGHGKVLLSLAPGPARVAMARTAATHGWNVRQTEQAVKRSLAGLVGAPGPRTRSAAVGDLERQLGEHLGTKVHIVTDRGGAKGRIVIEFYGLDHFDGLVSRLGFTPRS